jgi:hypothetical protein
MNYDLDTKDGMANSVAWTEHLFSTMRDGSVWGIPRSGTVVRVYPSKKEVRVQKGYTPDPSIKRVIKEMGWKIL